MKILFLISRLVLLSVIFMSIILVYYLLENKINVVDLAEMRYGYAVDFLIVNYGVRVTEFIFAAFLSCVGTMSFLILVDIPKLLW
jgi:hypothetical protein